jgi:hypothetical protein
LRLDLALNQVLLLLALHTVNLADWGIVDKPRMLTNLVKLDSLLWVSFEEFHNKVFRHAIETLGPLDAVIHYVVEQNRLICALERRATRKQFKQQNAQIPNVKTLIVATLLNHLRS